MSSATNPYPNALYQMGDVGKTLNLTPDQVAKLNDVTANTQARYRDDYGKLGTLADAARLARAMELNRSYDADWNKGARDVLDDAQRGRYRQMSYQYGGFDALHDPDVQKQLSLSADQQRDLRAQSDWSSQQVAAFNQMAATDPARATQMYRDYWTARQERLNKFLTPDQQKAWNQMAGDPYTFQPAFAPQR